MVKVINCVSVPGGQVSYALVFRKYQNVFQKSEELQLPPTTLEGSILFNTARDSIEGVMAELKLRR